MKFVHSAMFLFAVVSLIIAVVTYPHGEPKAVWLVAPIILFVPYGIIEAIKRRNDEL